MTTNILIFHGTNGHPEENWFPWLKKELEKLEYNVIIPQFPTPKNQTPETWFDIFNKYKQYINSDTILIGHSLGGTFLLQVLQNIGIQVKACFFIATPIGILPTKYYETDKPFLEKPFNWLEIKAHSWKFQVFHSDNDPFVCIENGEKLAKQLCVDLTVVKNAGHFNTKAGYIEFELLLEKIKQEIK
jgi:uncharacterized protein